MDVSRSLPAAAAVAASRRCAWISFLRSPSGRKFEYFVFGCLLELQPAVIQVL